MDNYVFAIEGNVGSGKSTLIKYLEKEKLEIYGYKIVFLPEPVEDWISIKNDEGSNIIQEYYKDNHKYGFCFQINALISRISQIRRALLTSSKTIFIIERSVHTDKFVFCKMLYDDKIIDKINYEVYLRWYNEFQKDMMITGIIYVNTDVGNSFNRIKIRNRKGEESISKEYLQKMNFPQNKMENILQFLKLSLIKPGERMSYSYDYFQLNDDINHNIQKIVQKVEQSELSKSYELLHFF